MPGASVLIAVHSWFARMMRTFTAAKVGSSVASVAPEFSGPHPTTEELFRRDDLAFDMEKHATIANAGRGSLLDSRWELARDSKLGIFQ